MIPLRAPVVLPIFTVIAVLLAACNGGNGEKTPTAETTATTAAVTRTLVTRTLETPAPSTTTPAGGGSAADEPVRFQTEDGVVISGHLYASAGPRRKVVVFAHEYPKDQKAWQGFAQELAASGIAALTFDFRGYGETAGSKDPTKADRDLSAAVRFIKSRDYLQVYVIGASFGGTAALKVLAKETGVTGLVTVSAPVEFMGLDARNDVASVRGAKLFLAARNDGSAAGAVGFFMQNALDPKESQVFEGSAHASDLLEGATAQPFRQAVLAFLNR